MSESVHLFLLGTEGCHLCEQALDVVLEVSQHFTRYGVPVQHVPVDIADHPDWVNAYGTCIPVVTWRWPSPRQGEELGWPFDQADLYHFIQQHLALKSS